MKPPKIFIVAAPSGTGKTTLNRRLVKENPQIEISISLTTRAQRQGEKNGDHYWFVGRDTFMEKVKTESMLEWAEVFGNLYGTSLDEIKRIQSKGFNPLLEIDVQGTKTIQKKIPSSVAILILPPSIESLWKRLSSRGTEALEVRWRRILTARDELDQGPNYQYFILNDDLEAAYQELRDLVINDIPVKLSWDDGINHCKKLIAEFNQAGWIKDLKNQFLTKPLK